MNAAGPDAPAARNRSFDLIGAFESQGQQPEIQEHVRTHQVHELEAHQAPKPDAQPTRHTPAATGSEATPHSIPSAAKPSHSSANARAGPSGGFPTRASNRSLGAGIIGIFAG